MKRREFMRRLVLGGVGAAALGGMYSVLEAKWLAVNERRITFERLPAGFDGFRIALVSDVHHGPFVPLDYVKHVVATVNREKPDAVCLLGDYVHRGGGYIAPCFEVLGKLRARRGVFGVLGNHDHWDGEREPRDCMANAGIEDLTNKGVWLESGGDRIRLGGVGDLMEGTQDLRRALGDAGKKDESPFSVVLSHNPDYAQSIRPGRVDLLLSGHTHGGQVQLPLLGAPVVPSVFGQKYLEGLVQAPGTAVFITRGVGTISPPVRFMCRPEVVILELGRPSDDPEPGARREERQNGTWA